MSCFFPLELVQYIFQFLYLLTFIFLCVRICLLILEGGKNGHFKAKVITRLKHQIRPILGLNFKMLKTYKERLYCHIAVVPCNKELESPPNISKNDKILEDDKNGNFAKVIVKKNWSNMAYFWVELQNA